MRCDIIAQGIIMAVRDLDLKIPIVVRLQGKTHTRRVTFVQRVKTCKSVAQRLSQNDHTVKVETVVTQMLLFRIRPPGIHTWI